MQMGRVISLNFSSNAREYWKSFFHLFIYTSFMQFHLICLMDSLAQGQVHNDQTGRFSTFSSVYWLSLSWDDLNLPQSHRAVLRGQQWVAPAPQHGHLTNYSLECLQEFEIFLTLHPNKSNPSHSPSPSILLYPFQQHSTLSYIARWLSRFRGPFTTNSVDRLGCLRMIFVVFNSVLPSLHTIRSLPSLQLSRTTFSTTITCNLSSELTDIRSR